MRSTDKIAGQLVALAGASGGLGGAIATYRSVAEEEARAYAHRVRAIRVTLGTTLILLGVTALFVPAFFVVKFGTAVTLDRSTGTHQAIAIVVAVASFALAWRAFPRGSD